MRTLRRKETRHKRADTMRPMHMEHRKRTKPMKALTVKQPWAWAIIHGGKDVENRSRATNHRGQLYIHAGLGYSKEADESQPMQEAWINAAQNLSIERGAMGPLRKRDLFLDYGALIGTVDVIGCHHSVTCFNRCSQWAMAGHYHWELSNPHPLPYPLPDKGRLGIWNVTAQVVTR